MVCENALVHELGKAGLFVEQQHPVTVYYDGVVVGSYGAVHQEASGLRLCLLLNFGTPRLEIKRLVNDA